MNIFRLSWWMTPVIGFRWVRARDLAITAGYEKCLKKLASIKRLRGLDIRPMGQWTAEFYILEGHAHYQLGRKDQALQSFKLAIQELKSPSDCDYNGDEKDYLLAYTTSTHSDLELAIDNQIDIESIDLDYVNRDIKLYFPLKAHPHWDHPDDEDDGLEA